MANSLWELFVKVSGDTSAFKKSMKESRDELGTFGGVAESTGRRIMTALALTGLGVGAANAARKFEESFAQIQRSTGATGEKLEGLEKSFTAVYRQTAASSEQVTVALSMLSTRTGTTGAALESLTLKTIALAKTQKEDVTAIVPLVTRAFGDWGITTDKQGRAMDYLRVVSQQTGSSVSRLAEQVVFAGAPLRQLGYSFEQSAVLIGKFEKEGVNTELVLGGMKAALQKFAKEGITDTAGAWKDFVAGVKDGSITLQAVMTEVGAKRGVDLYKAITEGRFEIDKMVDSLQTLAAYGGKSVQTLHEKFTMWTHTVESLAASHKDLILSVGLLVPVAVNLGGALAGIVRSVGSLGPALISILSNPVLLAFAAGGAAIGFGFSQLQESTAGLRSLDDAFGQWISGQVTGAKTADDLARAQQHVNDAFEKGLLSKEDTAKALDLIHQMQNKLAAQSWNVSKVAMGIDTSGIKVLPGGGLVDQSKALIETAEAAKKVKESLLQIPWYDKSLEGKILVDMISMQVAAWNADAQATANYRMFLLDGAKDGPIVAGQYKEMEDSVAAFDASMIGLNETWGKQALIWAHADPAVQAEGIKQLAIETGIADKERSAAMAVATKEQNAFDRDAHRVWNSMTNAIAKNIVDWKGWKDTVLNVGKDFATGFLDILMKSLFAPLEKEFAKQAGRIGVWLTSIMGGTGGGASSAIGGAASIATTPAMQAVGIGSAAVPAATSALGGGAKAASGIASAGLASTVGAIASVGSLISGVVGNFQMAGMNKTLDLLEKSFRYVEIYVGGNGQENIFFFSKLSWLTLVEIKDLTSKYLPSLLTAAESGGGSKGGGSGSLSITNNNCSFSGTSESAINAMMESAFRKLQLAQG